MSDYSHGRVDAIYPVCCTRYPGRNVSSSKTRIFPLAITSLTHTTSHSVLHLRATHSGAFTIFHFFCSLCITQKWVCRVFIVVVQILVCVILKFQTLASKTSLVCATTKHEFITYLQHDKQDDTFITDLHWKLRKKCQARKRVYKPQKMLL